REHFGGELRQKRIAVWGLSFKPGTDDVRSAPSLALIQNLVEQGAQIIAYDPVAIKAARAALGATTIQFADSARGACDGADALVLMTEWEEFKAVDLNSVAARLRGNTVFDGRGVYDAAQLECHGLRLHRYGQPRVATPANHATGSTLASI